MPSDLESNISCPQKAASESKRDGKPASGRARGLSGSLFGLLPVIRILGNSYENKYWPEHATGGEARTCMELMWLKDLGTFKNWAGRIDSASQLEMADAQGQLIREVLGAPRTAPTIIYLLGHTTRSNDGKLVLLPAECYENGPQIHMGVPFLEIRDLLLMDPNPAPLLLVNDFCDCTNILGLPFVLRHDGANSYWEEVKGCSPNSWPKNKVVLHFTATDENQMAHEFESAGGIFTREFCNICPRRSITLGDRSQSIQKHMDEFFDKYEKLHPGKRPVQQHQVYSSHKQVLTDKRIFRKLGFCQ